MKKTIKNYCLNATQRKLSELYEIADRYASVKNEVFYQYGSLSGLQYLSYPRKVRDQWIKDGTGNKFGLQARQWKLAMNEAFSNINSNWSNTFNKVRKNLYKNNAYSKNEKYYAFYLLKATNLLYEALTFRFFNLPKKFEDIDIYREKIHKYLKSRIRKYMGKKPYQYKHRTFLVDREMYDTEIDSKGRLWLAITSLNPRKRIKLLMTSKEPFFGTLKIVLKGDKVEIHQTTEVKIKELKEGKEGETIALDKGFQWVITSSNGNKYGEGFNKLLKDESNRFSDKNKKRNKLRALSENYEKNGNIIKAENIRYNNLGVKKYIHLKEIGLNNLKRFINQALNLFFKSENPSILVIENLKWTNWNKKLSKKVKRYFSSWLKGYLQERIDYKTMLNGVQQVVVNPAYGSQVCCLCGYFGVRKGDKFYCEIHGVLDADYNATLNYLARVFDTEITVYTPYWKVKDILQERLRLSNQDSRYAYGRIISDNTTSSLGERIN